MRTNFDFTHCHTLADVKAVVFDALENETIVPDRTCASLLFKAEGFKGDVIMRQAFAQNIELWNEELQRHEDAHVRIYEYYTDSGSDDYLYSYDVSIY